MNDEEGAKIRVTEHLGSICIWESEKTLDDREAAFFSDDLICVAAEEKDDLIRMFEMSSAEDLRRKLHDLSAKFSAHAFDDLDEWLDASFPHGEV
jgi:hypothetical protein